MEREFAERYADLERWHWWFRGRQQILEDVLRRRLDGRTSLAIASVGAGPPEGLAWLLALAGPQGRLVGLDSEVIHGRRPDPRLEYVVGDLGAPPSPLPPSTWSWPSTCSSIWTTTRQRSPAPPGS